VSSPRFHDRPPSDPSTPGRMRREAVRVKGNLWRGTVDIDHESTEGGARFPPPRRFTWLLRLFTFQVPPLFAAVASGARAFADPGLRGVDR
jgi:hypothetical protein